jgi:hypothetical protein
VINAFGIIGTRIEVIRAELNFFLAKFAIETRQTTASVRLNAINTCSIVLTLMILTIVDIDFAARSFIAGQTLTAKATLLEYTTTAIISTWIAVASINHMLTMCAMIARSTTTFVLLFGLHDTLAIVFAWERKAGITFRQNFITDFLFAEELTGRCRENELVLHTFWFGTTCNARLNIIQFYPFREPFE